MAPILVAFWTPFGTNFLNISRFPENFYFATSPQRNAHFHFPNPLILRPNFNQILMFFRVSFSDTLFSSFFQHDTQKHDFWTPLGIQLGPKWHPKSAKWRKNAPKTKSLCSFLGASAKALPQKRLLEHSWSPFAPFRDRCRHHFCRF